MKQENDTKKRKDWTGAKKRKRKAIRKGERDWGLEERSGQNERRGR